MRMGSRGEQRRAKSERSVFAFAFAFMGYAALDATCDARLRGFSISGFSSGGYAHGALARSLLPFVFSPVVVVVVVIRHF